MNNVLTGVLGLQQWAGVQTLSASASLHEASLQQIRPSPDLFAATNPQTATNFPIKMPFAFLGLSRFGLPVLHAPKLSTSPSPSSSAPGDPKDPKKSYDFEGKSRRDRLGRWMQFQWGRIQYALTLAPLNPARIQRFVAQEAAHLGTITPNEMELLKQIQSLCKDEIRIFLLLREYRGPRNQLVSQLEKLFSWFQGVQEGLFDLHEWLYFEGFEEVRNLWSQYQVQGWRAQPYFGKLITDKRGAQVFPDSKKVVIRMAPAEEPLPLVIAEEIYHLEAMDLIDKNGEKLQTWVRERIGRFVFKDLLASVDQMTRGSWQFKALIEESSRTIPEPNIRIAISFLLERDAMYKKLALYEKLVAKHPEFKSKSWEDIRMSRDPRKTITTLLNQLRFHLQVDFVAQLELFSLDEIIQGIDGKTLTDLDRASVASISVPSIEWSDWDQALETTPRVLKEKPIDGRFGERGLYIKTRGSTLSAEEAAGLVAYLERPEITLDPYAAERSLERKWGAQYSLELSEAQRNCLAIRDNVSYGIELLSAYDKEHDTHFGIEMVNKILSRLQPNKDTSDYRDNIYGMTIVVNQSTDSQVVVKFFEALSISPSIGGFFKDPNATHYIEELLQKVKGLSLENSFLKNIEIILKGYIDYNARVGRVAGDLGNRNMSLLVAFQMAQVASDYFGAIGDTVREGAFRFLHGQIYREFTEGSSSWS